MPAVAPEEAGLAEAGRAGGGDVPRDRAGEVGRGPAPEDLGAGGHEPAEHRVVPWTVDDFPPMAKLLEDGVDGLITDYPDRLRSLLAARGYQLPRAYRPSVAD